MWSEGVVKQENPEKNPRSKDENKHLTQSLSQRMRSGRRPYLWEAGARNSVRGALRSTANANSVIGLQSLSRFGITSVNLLKYKTVYDFGKSWRNARVRVPGFPFSPLSLGFHSTRDHEETGDEGSLVTWPELSSRAVSAFGTEGRKCKNI